jgi:hypothetical protein
MRLISRKKLAVLFSFIVIVVCSNLFFVSSVKVAEVRTINLQDPMTCRTCHQAITDSFLRTAHYLDSRPADSFSIKGSFAEGANRYRYNQFMEVIMYREGDKYHQAALVNGMLTTSAPFDVVIGSGRNGQTYLTWLDNQLFQLPISYYAPARQWCNSPGFPNYYYFGRKVAPNCLECHSTNTKVLSHEEMQYDSASIVYGITCARCHPSSAEHANFHMANPNEKNAKHVVNAARLNRQLRMDACALCHSGLRTALEHPFSFKVGDSLEKYSVGSPVSKQADTLDVHGNQYGLLTASECYIKSTTMDCSTCHDVHRNEYKNPKLFSSRCMTCHDGVKHLECTMKENKNIVKSDNCIDCHMPVLASKNILLNVKTGDELLPDYLRSHYIAVYPDKTLEFIKRNKKNK